jgi:hypothetical protein
MFDRFFISHPTEHRFSFLLLPRRGSCIQPLRSLLPPCLLACPPPHPPPAPAPASAVVAHTSIIIASRAALPLGSVCTTALAWPSSFKETFLSLRCSTFRSLHPRPRASPTPHLLPNVIPISNARVMTQPLDEAKSVPPSPQPSPIVAAP